jgi:hypothetical protein
MTRRLPAASERPQAAFKGQTTHVRSFPAPIGGWNKRDPIAGMKPTDAVNLVNWFPRVTDCVIRGGESDHVTGFADRPKSLMLYSPPNASNKLFAGANSGVYDVSSPGAVGAPVAACTNGYWNWTQMGVSGGHYLLAFNGTDEPLYFDGTNWISVDGASTPALTGVTTTDLVTAMVYKRRLFVIEKDDLGFWYLAADAVGGALNHFLLGPVCQRGGYLMAAGSWSFDGGDGPDDYAVFVTSQGEVVLFTGNDPGDSQAWAHVGTYFIGPPLGRKCLEKYGGDLIVLTQFGAFPLSKALLSATIDYKLALTNKIEGAFNEAARLYGSLEGWEACILPTQSAFIFNIPSQANGATAQQYVMNTTTKSWCSFSGWNASCFEVFNNELYFADSDRIAKAWSGVSDHGTYITAAAQTAYNNFGMSTQLKEWNLLRPMLLVNGPLEFSIGYSIDFKSPGPLSQAFYTVVTGAQWDVDLWDDALWAAGLEIRNDWRTAAAVPGYWASMLLRIDTNDLEVQWVANDFTYTVGGVVG